MAKSRANGFHPDVIVVGEHPAAYLAAAILKSKSAKADVVHVAAAGKDAGKGTGDDRLVLVNPTLFSLHPVLSPLKRLLDLTSICGIRFLSDDPKIYREYRSKSTLNCVAKFSDVRAAMAKIARQNGVNLQESADLKIHAPDEEGLDFELGKHRYRAKAAIVAGGLEKSQAKILGIDDAWDRDVLYRYSYVRLEKACRIPASGKAILPMSLDLGRKLDWAWMLPFQNTGQLCVMHQISHGQAQDPLAMLRRWRGILLAHNLIEAGGEEIAADDVVSMDIPLAGALSREGVANRTLLIGPAGGFYSASAEDLYPNCWSALFAAEVMWKSLKEQHLQDALQMFGQKWRTTLGDYLRGPQQNLRFLLPLVYRNEVMAARMVEAILTGKSMVRG